jgi:hypothetical protein
MEPEATGRPDEADGDSLGAQDYNPIVDTIFPEPPPRVISKLLPPVLTRKSRPVSDKLRQILGSESTYKQVSQRTKERAKTEYDRLVPTACALLLESQEFLRGRVDADADEPGGPWRKDPGDLSEHDLRIGIQLLEFKIKRVKEQNAALAAKRQKLAGKREALADGRAAADPDAGPP